MIVHMCTQYRIQNGLAIERHNVKKYNYMLYYSHPSFCAMHLVALQVKDRLLCVSRMHTVRHLITWQYYNLTTIVKGHRCTHLLATCIIIFYRPSPSNQSIYRQIADHHGRVGDHIG